MHKVFLHVDMDAFFAAVEQRDRPELLGKPVVVGAPPDQRGVVSAASYEAREYGIHSAMPSREAGERCPHAVFLPVDGKRYKAASRAIFHIFERFTPLIEPLSIDEAFLDVTGSRALFGSGPEIAAKIRARIKNELTLTASVGVAHNKFLAKLASDLEKPDGLTVVPSDPEEIRAFLAPLGISRIWGVGKVTQRNLEEIGITTIGQIQNASARQLNSVFGHTSAHIIALANGEDSREIQTSRQEKSISREHTFKHDCTKIARLEKTLCGLVEDVGSQLRSLERYASIGQLKLRWQGFKTITRRTQITPACCDDFTLRDIALALFRKEKITKPVRLIGFAVSGLVDERPSEQLNLFASGPERGDKRENVSNAVDRIRDKFGNDAIGGGRGIIEEEDES